MSTFGSPGALPTTKPKPYVFNVFIPRITLYPLFSPTLSFPLVIQLTEFMNTSAHSVEASRWTTTVSQN